MPDLHANFAHSLVATAPSPAPSGTSLVVTAGTGTKFPAAPFNATVWPAATQPTTANAEIVRVTNISTDTLTITRAQESSSARTIVVGDQIAATITAKTLTDVETAFARANHTGSQAAATVSDFDTQVATTAVLKSFVDAKGDVISASADNTPARLAVGVNHTETLVPDSSTATGLKWGVRRTALKATAALAETAPRNNHGVATGSILANQRLNLVAIELPSGMTVTSITFVTGSTALTPGSGTNHQIFGLYDDSSGSSSGTARALLRGTSDDGSTAWGANTPKTLTLTSTYLTTRSGLFYLGILIDFGTAGTLPTFSATSVLPGVAGLAPILNGASSTAQTALPDPAAALSAAQSSYPYAYVS